MQSNPFASLPGDFGARAAALVAKREIDGRNVHFVNERGQWDRCSFASHARADAFRLALGRNGRPAIVPMDGEYYVYLADKLARVCPSLPMAFDVAAGVGESVQ